jgi:large subunit ribosomal protein L5
MSFLREKYNKEAVPDLMDEFGITNQLRVPDVDKVVLNMGLGEATENPKVIEEAVDEMALITGQEPVVTNARRSIAGFHLREGMPIGVKVTLRDKRMYEFLERLVYVSLPRVRDFNGISPDAFDGHGNYSLGINDQTIFPEIDYDNVDTIRGLQVTVVTTAENDEQGKRLLEKLGFPFKDMNE